MTRYITASIPYVNSTPHIGHAVEFVQVDALIRYYAAKGEVVRGQFGSDDNSLKNVRAAKEAGEEIESYVARHAQAFKDLATTLNLSDQMNHFIRTRDDIHLRGAQKLWSSFRPEDVYKKSYEGLYCVGCEAFYSAEDLIDGNLCPTHKKPVDSVKEENYFFKLSNYQKVFEDLIGKGLYVDRAGKEHRLTIVPEKRRNEMLAFVAKLEDFSISRSRERAENWGVTVPGDEGQVMYVWADALSNYITALGYAEGAQEFTDFWLQSDVRTHVIGKDILRFHAIYWPAFLLSAGLPLPTTIFAHGFLTVEGTKMSKSIGNVIAPADLVEKYGVDATRFLLLQALPFSNDGDLSARILDEGYDRLANGLGNLVGRVAAMAGKYFEGKVDKFNWIDFVGNSEVGAGSTGLREIVDRLPAEIEGYDFKSYIESIWEVIDAANLKIQVEEPFKTAKTDPLACKKTLSELAAIILVIAEALMPIMPNIAGEIKKRYNGEVLIHGEPLFPKNTV